MLLIFFRVFIPRLPPEGVRIVITNVRPIFFKSSFWSLAAL